MFKPGMLALILILTACLPIIPGQTAINQPPQSIPTVDLNLATETMTGTVVAQTSEVLPTPQLLPSSTFTAIPSLTPSTLPANTTTLSVTSITGSPTVTITGTPSSGPFAIDTLPPGTDYGSIRLENKSNRKADVTLYCTTRQGYQTILDYSSVRSMTINAPQGNYSYLVYVNGVKLSGGFSFLANQKLTLTIYRDKVVIH